MNFHLGLKVGCASVLAGLLMFGAPVRAASLVLDDFSVPGAAVLQTPTGTGAQFFDRTFDTFAGVAGQVRESNYNLYSDPLSSGANVLLGGGIAAVVAGSEALGEFLFAYGAFTRPTGDPAIGGPLMGLDLTAFNSFRAEFSGVAQALNLNVVLYTSAPNLLPDNTPLFYLQSGINIAPGAPGDPLTADLFLNALPIAAYFNFSQVDGIVFLIDRSANSRGNAYALDTLLFTQAVPEPSEWLLMLGGLALMMGVARRRKV